MTSSQTENFLSTLTTPYPLSTISFSTSSLPSSSLPSSSGPAVSPTSPRSLPPALAPPLPPPLPSPFFSLSPSRLSVPTLQEPTLQEMPEDEPPTQVPAPFAIPVDPDTSPRDNTLLEAEFGHSFLHRCEITGLDCHRKLARRVLTLLNEQPTRKRTENLLRDFTFMRFPTRCRQDGLRAMESFCQRHALWLSCCDIERFVAGAMTEKAWDFLERGVDSGDEASLEQWTELKNSQGSILPQPLIVYPKILNLLEAHLIHDLAVIVLLHLADVCTCKNCSFSSPWPLSPVSEG
jgi:hypothetical protein